MAAAAMAQTTAPKKLNKEEWRYPKYIVDPRVMCLTEGVFPHPRNCSWYYRCVDRMNVGFYFTYYFECEPGTVFDDVLDQCVFPHLAAPPCGTSGSGPDPSPPTLPGPTRPTFPPTQPPTPIPTRPPTQPTPVTRPTPPPTPATPAPTPPPQPTPTTSATVVTPIKCTFHQRNCEIREYCQPVRAFRNLCSGCNIGEVLISTDDFCNGVNKVFDKDLNSCVDKPPESALCPTTPAPVPTTVTPPPSPGGVPIQNENTFTCSVAKPIPDEPWIKRTYCENYALCDPGQQFKGFKELCTNYYECSRTPQNTWTYAIKDCSGQGQYFYYSFEENTCVRLPPEERC